MAYTPLDPHTPSGPKGTDGLTKLSPSTSYRMDCRAIAVAMRPPSLLFCTCYLVSRGTPRIKRFERVTGVSCAAHGARKPR